MAMAPPMAPEAAPKAPAGPAPEAAPPSPSKSPKDLVVGINDDMMQLMDLFAKTQAVSPEEKQRLGSVISEFQSIVDGLGQPPGAPKAPGAPPQGPSGPVTMEAGANPNARPV